MTLTIGQIEEIFNRFTGAREADTLRMVLTLADCEFKDLNIGKQTMAKDAITKLSEYMTPPDAEFCVVWKDQTVEIIKGKSLQQAFSSAGYGAGAMGAVDFMTPREKFNCVLVKQKNGKFVWSGEDMDGMKKVNEKVTMGELTVEHYYE